MTKPQAPSAPALGSSRRARVLRAVLDQIGALSLVTIGLAVQGLIEQRFGGPVTFQFMLLMLALCAWQYRLLTTLVTIFIAALAQDLLFLDPRGSLSIANTGDAVKFFFFVTVSLVIALLAERLRRSRNMSDATLRKLETSDRARLTSEHRLDAALNALGDPVLMLLPVRNDRGEVTDFVVEYANRAAIATVGPGQKLSEAAPEHASLELIQAYAEVIADGTPFDGTATLPALPGRANSPGGASSPRVFEVRADRLADGVVVRWHDVSERRGIEQKIQMSQERYRSLVRAMGAIVWSMPTGGEFGAPQPDWSAFTGQMFEQLKGTGWLDAVHPDDRDDTREAWSRAVVHQREYEVEHRLKRGDGEYRNMVVRAVAMVGQQGEVREWVGVHSDVTDRRRAEHILADSEQQLRRVLNSLYAFVSVLLPDGSLIGVNEAPLRAGGLTPRDVVGRKIWDCGWFADDAALQATLRDWIARAGLGETVRGDLSTRMANGVLTVDTMLAPLRDENGSITHLIQSGVDVSARIAAQNDLADRERRFRRLYESDIAGIVFYHPDGTLSDPNDAFRRLLGYGQKSLPDRWNWNDLIPPEWAKLDEAEQAKLEQSGRCGPYAAEFFRSDGTRVPVLITGADLNPGTREVGVASVIDMTALRGAEEALRQSEADLRMANESLERRIQERTLELQQRSEQLRALALDLTETESRERKRFAQLLHDHFQQLVSAAKLKVGMLRRKLTDESLIATVRQVEGLLEETIDASRSLATELSPPVLHDAGLGPALEWLARRMERDHQLRVDLTVQENSEPENEQVRVIIFECVRELLLNVVNHAKAKTATLELSMAAEGLLQIRVTDQGPGFDAHAIELKAKPDGSFGLFNIQERLAMLGGLMKVRSQAGHGTTVSITVPVMIKVEADHVVAGRLIHPPIADPTVNALASVPDVRVLVADDHRLFREGLISLITQESFVHVVGQAGDGEEALTLARELRPDILIADVTMPKLNGIQLTAAVRRELPDTRVIGLSMHELDDMADAMRDAGASAYCSKSGPTETLINVIKGVASASTLQS